MCYRQDDRWKKKGMNHVHLIFNSLIVLVLVITWPLALHAQVPPSSGEISRYSGLLAAAARGDAAQIKALLAQGESPNVTDGYERTPLHVATYGGHHAAMRVLVAAGANVNVSDPQGNTPLSLAQSRGYQEMVAILQRAP
jgi:ankyrin repeat protein